MFSCNKDENDEPLAEAKNTAVITLTQPMMSDHIHHEDTLKVRGTITSVKDMHGYSVNIVRNTDNSEVFAMQDHYHGMNKNLSVNWPCDINENVELKVTVSATLDHDGTKESKSVLIMCQQ